MVAWWYSKRNKMWLRVVALVVSSVLFFTQVVGASLPDRSFWAERRKASQKLLASKEVEELTSHQTSASLRKKNRFVYFFKYFRNSLKETIGILWKDLRESKSLSPDTIKSALPSRAVSKILLSSKSRQISTFIDGFTNSAFISIILNKSSTSLIEMLPSSLLVNTSLISLIIDSDNISTNFLSSKYWDIDLTDLPPNREEMNMLVSITTLSFFFIEFLSYFLTDLGDLLKRNRFFCFRAQDGDNLSEPIRKKFLFKLFQEFNSFFGRKFKNSSFNFPGINFYRNFVHNCLLLHTILLRRASSNFTHFSDHKLIIFGQECQAYKFILFVLRTNTFINNLRGCIWARIPT